MRDSDKLRDPGWADSLGSGPTGQCPAWDVGEGTEHIPCLHPVGHRPIFDTSGQSTDSWDHGNADYGLLWNEVDSEAEVVHTSHMTTSNLTYVISVRTGEGVTGFPLAVRTVKQAAIDIAVVYNADRYDRWAEVTEYDTTSVRPGVPVELPAR